MPQIARDIAQASHMNYFSTEVVAVGQPGRHRFLAIDYVNDPCDMTVQSLSHCGVPDRLVEHMAERFTEAAWRVARGNGSSEDGFVWFAD